MWTTLPKQVVEPHLCLTGGPMCLSLSSDKAMRGENREKIRMQGQ